MSLCHPSLLLHATPRACESWGGRKAPPDGFCARMQPRGALAATPAVPAAYPTRSDAKASPAPLTTAFLLSPTHSGFPGSAAWGRFSSFSSLMADI